MTTYEPEIRRFLSDQFLFGDDRPLGPDESLLDAGIVDSTGLLELINFLEERYGIKVQDDELLPENLDTVGRLCAFLERKLA
jgi:acyl carrier protein